MFTEVGAGVEEQEVAEEKNMDMVGGSILMPPITNVRIGYRKDGIFF